MDYKITIGNESKELEFDSARSSDGNFEEYTVTVKSNPSKTAKITVLKREKDRLIVSIGQRVYSVIQTGRTRSSVSLLVDGINIRASTVEGESETGSLSGSLIATANELVASNFPAKVVKLLVKKGDSPKEGDTLVVLEAMKMEAQIKAPRNCTVEDVFVKEGDMVERGKAMIRLKFG